MFAVSTANATKTASSVPDHVQDFNFDGDTIHTLVPQGWTAMNGALNIPVALVSEKGTQDQRAVIEITPYGKKDAGGVFSKLKKDPENFYDQKEEWLSKTDGQSISYLPFNERKLDGSTIYSIGIKYKSAQGNFLDETYYISTKSKQLYSIKVLEPLDLVKTHDVAINEVINSVSTRN
jgi:hypothetical protein